MPFVVHVPRAAPLTVDADEHRVEGGWHVFRRSTPVMGRPRPVVVLRLAVADGQVVEQVLPAPETGP
jgi:hypothetical protein